MRNPFAPLLRRSARRKVLTDMLTLDDHLLRDIGLTRTDVTRAGALRSHSIHE